MLGKSYVKAPFVRMFGGEAGGFNPDLLSGRLEEMLPTIQQVMHQKIFWADQTNKASILNFAGQLVNHTFEVSF